jgi:NAD(P)-dependent dehydrogenase (short-subunit alcohol dehydrogenase family)
MKRPEVVVVTGASAGVGRATVRAFAKRGANLGLLARASEGLEAARREVEDFGGKALAVPTDMADPEAVERAAEAIEKELGPIDVWVNDAMTSIFAPFHEVKPEEFKRVTEVLYLGFVYGTMSALKRMRPRGRGTIIQVSSALAYRSIPLQSAYCGAKHAIIGFTDSLRCELVHERSKIKLVAVDMPGLNTPQFGWVKSRLPHKAQPVPPIFQPEVAAEAIVWAADHPRREVLVGGSTILAIWGQKFVPGLLDIYLGKTGYSGQQYDGPADPERPDNLWEPLEGDFGAHGAFDDRAKTSSPALWLVQNRNWLALAAAGAGALALAAVSGKRPARGNHS